MNEKSETSNYPLVETEATLMLARGLSKAQAERGLTQRDVARHLGYKSSVVVSHIASGRVPIPIDRAAEIASLLELEPSRFLLAVLQQRHPNIDFGTLFGSAIPERSSGKIATELETIAGRRLDDLDRSTIQVLREVVAAALPAKRWLAVAEVPVMEAIRQRHPAIAERGVTEDEQQLIEACFNRVLHGAHPKSHH